MWRNFNFGFNDIYNAYLTFYASGTSLNYFIACKFIFNCTHLPNINAY